MSATLMNMPLIRCLACIVCCLPLWNTARAQRLNEDSLYKLITTTPYDTARADALFALAQYQIKHTMQDSIGLLTLQRGYELANRIHYKEGLVQVWLIKGNYYNSKQQVRQSLEAFDKMIITAQEMRNDSMRNRALMMAYNNTGGIYNANGDFRNSLLSRLKALEIVEKHMPDNYIYQSIIFLNIASDYRQLQMPAKALEYLDKTSAFFPKLSGRLKMEYYYEYYHNYLNDSNNAGAKLMLEKMKNGIKTYELTPFQQKDYSMMLAKVSGNYQMHVAKNYALALQYYRSYMLLAKELKQHRDVIESLYSIGKAQLKGGNVPAAVTYLQMANDSAVLHGLKKLAMEIQLSLSDAHRYNGDALKANQILRDAMDQKSEIYKVATVKELATVEALYQSEKKKHEIAALQLANTAKALTIVKRERLLLTGGIATMLVLLVAGVLYNRNYRRRKRAERAEQVQQQQVLFLQKQQQLVSLQSMINGQETERTRIAKDLHDGLGGLFSTIKMHFSTLQHEMGELKQYPLFTRSYELVNTASEEVRRIAHNMMPEVLIRIGLVPAVQELCNSISAAKLLQVSMQSYGMDKRLNVDTEIMLYRIVQELLNNIIKHADASEALVQFNKQEGRLHITIEDNGRGFNTADAEGSGVGLGSVKSRVDYLNGTLSIESEKEIGTTVMMVFLINE